MPIQPLHCMMHNILRFTFYVLINTPIISYSILAQEVFDDDPEYEWAYGC